MLLLPLPKLDTALTVTCGPAVTPSVGLSSMPVARKIMLMLLLHASGAVAKETSEETSEAFCCCALQGVYLSLYEVYLASAAQMRAKPDSIEVCKYAPRQQQP